MGPMDSPVIPVAYRERGLPPFTKQEKGVELTLRDGSTAQFWGKSYAEAIDNARKAGHEV